MTRINVIPVVQLMDQHIQAEYFELPRIFKLVAKHWSQGRKPESLDIPDTYRLGEGHMKFFYDKLTYLQNRHHELSVEGKRRDLSLTVDPNVGAYLLPPIFEPWWKDYTPTEEALTINWERINQKIAMYPSWYKYEGIPFSAFV